MQCAIEDKAGAAVGPSFAWFQKNTHCKLFFCFYQLLETVSVSTSNSLNSCPPFLWFQLAVKMPALGRRKTACSPRMSHTSQQQLLIIHGIIKCLEFGDISPGGRDAAGSRDPTAGQTAGGHLSTYSEQELPGRGLAGFIVSY